MKLKKFEILVGGDFFVKDNFNSSVLFSQELIKLFKKVDYRIINLETPIIDSQKKLAINKTGPNLFTTKKTIVPLLNELQINLVSLANNHIMDYGDNGLFETIGHCKNNGIETVGAGNNIEEASKPVIIKNNDYKIAILNLAENEWSSATENTAGANPMDIIDNFKQIQNAKSQNDFVIVIIHGGHEYYHLPSPRMKKQYRFYTKAGADAIVGHHTHCVGGNEVFNNVPIIYSLGNFLFTINSPHEKWYTGLLLNLIISKNHPISFKLIPIQQQKSDFSLNILNGEEKETIIKEIETYNAIINDDSMLNKKWEFFLKENTKKYLQNLSPINIFGSRYIRRGLNLLKTNKFILSKNYLKLQLNLMRCEAHVDATKSILTKQLINK